jgi:hypothetical protein
MEKLLILRMKVESENAHALRMSQWSLLLFNALIATTAPHGSRQPKSAIQRLQEINAKEGLSWPTEEQALGASIPTFSLNSAPKLPQADTSISPHPREIAERIVSGIPCSGLDPQQALGMLDLAIKYRQEYTMTSTASAPEDDVTMLDNPRN